MSNLKSDVSVEETFDLKKGRLQGRERTDFKIGGQQWRRRDVRFEIGRLQMSDFQKK